jgi:hypothetical protein
MEDAPSAASMTDEEREDLYEQLIPKVPSEVVAQFEPSVVPLELALVYCLRRFDVLSDDPEEVYVACYGFAAHQSA